MILSIPKDPAENLRWRAKLLRKARTDENLRAHLRKLFYDDILFAFNAFFFTFDVRRRPFHHLPFCTYEFQDKTILAIQAHLRDGRDLVIEKSRDMGVSWMVILTMFHFWLNAEGGADFLLGSRIEDYVDKKGDMRTLLQKARYTLYRLPRWLWPEGFVAKRHDNYMRLQNPQTGASVTGESNNANWSTGGRYLGALLDEFAKWESTDTSAWTAAGDATPCRIAVSTPFGAAGQCYNLVTSDRIDKITLHWSLHPLKADGLYCVYPKSEEADETVDSDHWIGLRSPWYDNECRRRQPSEIAQELDINYLGSGAPVFEGRAGTRVNQLLRARREPVRMLEWNHLISSFVPLSYRSADDETGLLKIFEEPSEKLTYITASDVAEGKESGDFCVCKVLCRQTEDVVATFAEQIDEVQFSSIVAEITKLYSVPRDAAYWAVETNGPGLAMFDLMSVNHDLPNAFMMPTYGTSREVISYRKGWWTDTNSRRYLVSKIKQWLLKGSGWADLRLVKEMTTFVRGTMKPEAKAGAHDDEVLAFGIALCVNEIVPSADEINVSTISQTSRDVIWQTPTPVSVKSLHQQCLETIRERLEEQAEQAMSFGYVNEVTFDELFG